MGPSWTTFPSGLSLKRSSSGCPPRTSFAAVLYASCGAVPPSPTSSCSTIAAASRRSLSSTMIYLGRKESPLLSSVITVLEPPIESSGQSFNTLKFHNLLGSCDGFLILSGGSDFWICNLTTRRCAPLPQPRVPPSSPGGSCIYIAGFYQHHPSGEYRVLWFSSGCHRAYVLTVGSDKPRIISRPSLPSYLPECRREWAFDSCYSSQVNHRGSLHWLTGIDMETPVDIMVFDTITETFRWMRSSGQLGRQVSLWEMDDKLASCSTNDASIEIWMMQDYEAEAWALKYRINLLAMKASEQFEYISKTALLNQRELLICYHTPSDGPDCLLHCDIDGNFLGYYEMEGGTYSVYFTNQYFQESMIPLPFCEIQEEGGVDKEPSFFIGLQELQNSWKARNHCKRFRRLFPIL